MYKRFLQFGLFLLAMVLFGSLGVSKAQAGNVSTSTTILYPANNAGSTWTKNGNTYTKSVEVPSTCSNPLFIMTGNIWYSHQPNTIKYNDVSFTKAGEYNIDSEKHMVVWYLVAPTTGTNTLTFSEDYGDRPLQFMLFCDVDPDTPFATSFTQQVELTTTNININENTTAVIAIGISDSFNYYPSGFTEVSRTGSTGEQTFFALKDSISTSDLYYSVGNGIGAYAVLNYKSPSPPLSGTYLLYYGSNPYYVPINSQYDMPFVYDICTEWAASSSDSFYVVLENASGTPLASPLMLSQCTSAVHYNVSSDSTLYSETAHLTIFDFDTSQDIATSSEFLATSYSPVPTGSYIVPSSGLFLADTTNASTTLVIDFSYNVCGDANFSTNNEFRIKNLDTNYLISDASVHPSSCSGTSSISILVSQSSHYYYSASIVYYSSSFNGYVNVLGEMFSSSPFLIGYSTITAVRQATSSSAYLGVSAHDLACSPAEWADIENTSNWFNLNGLKCNVFETGLNIVFAIADVPKSFLMSTRDVVLGMFPFNIPNQLLIAYDKSVPELPAALQYWNIADNNGDVGISIPAEWVSSSSDMIVPVWGAGVLASPGSKQAAFFAGVRAFSTYILWLIFISYIIGLGMRIYSDITGEEEGDFELTSIHYDKAGNYSADYRPRK